MNDLRVLYHGSILTLDPARPAATALAVQHGRVIFTGSDQDVLAEFGDRGERVDLAGKTVWPGLNDAHLHLDYYSLGLMKVDCETATREECLARVAQRASQTPPGMWIQGHGWNQNTWPEGFGDAAMLDKAAPRNPVYLTGKSLHAGWANSLAMQAAGIHADTADPEGGSLQRDPRGKPTGVVFEKAMELVANVLPEPSPQELAGAIQDAQAAFWRMGITGVHDFDQQRCFSALQILEARDALRLRVVKGIAFNAFRAAVETGLRTGFGSQFIRTGCLKLFADGALGPQTAAMFQPYERTSDQYGMLFLDEEQIFEIGCQAVDHGISLAVHAIGDRAVHGVIDAYERLRGYEKSHGLEPGRHRIEHVQILHPSDVGRLAELGIIASMQPVHATSDMLIADHHWGRRSANAYAWRTLLDRHTVLAFGSDAPVESPNPFWGIHAAVTRRRQDGAPNPEGWYPEQKISLLEAIKGYTINASFAAGQEKQAGRLAPGYFADLIVLPEDPFSIPADHVADVTPDAVMVAGEWVWERK